MKKYAILLASILAFGTVACEKKEAATAPAATAADAAAPAPAAAAAKPATAPKKDAAKK